MGNYIWAGSQKVGKFEELVALEAEGELGRVGVAIVGEWVMDCKGHEDTLGVTDVFMMFI